MVITDEQISNDLSSFFGEAKKKFPDMTDKINEAVTRIEKTGNIKLNTEKGFSTPSERAKKHQERIKTATPPDPEDDPDYLDILGD